MSDLAGFASAIVLAMIALLIGYEAIARFMSPVPIHFGEAIPISVVGLMVNIVSVWLLSGGGHHDHGHKHGHDEGDKKELAEELQYINTPAGTVSLSIFEEGISPVFRIQQDSKDAVLAAHDVTVTTIRSDGISQTFNFKKKLGFLESTTDIPEPLEFNILIKLPGSEHTTTFEEHVHGHDDKEVDTRDLNMRAAYIHVIADAAVSVMAIIGLILVKAFGWLWMAPLAGIVSALVIANWSFGLIRDTGAILLNVNQDNKMIGKVRFAIEMADDKLIDLHVWRLGPSHFGDVVSLVTRGNNRGPAFYHASLGQIKGLSHITVEVNAYQQVAV